MAFAFGSGAHMVGAHVGFGLGFLNFLGTILFFAFIFMLIKGVMRSRYARGSGAWKDVDWRQQAQERFRSWSEQPGPQKASHPYYDEAMTVARERLANSEISPDEFEVVKQGLWDSQPAEGDAYRKHDAAINTARMRFAKGDINADEFDAVIKALG